MLSTPVKYIETTQIDMATAKQKIATQLPKNLPSSTVMPDGKFLALEYKTVLPRSFDNVKVWLTALDVRLFAAGMEGIYLKGR